MPSAPLAFYVHVPFCRVRCGYCDFNTYAPGELTGPESAPSSYVDAALAEITQARHTLAESAQSNPEIPPSRRKVTPPPVDTVFFGGGTPTLLPSADLGRLLGRIRTEFGLTEGAEVTTEANPDSVTPESLAELRAAGFTRISFGMQSAVPHVLAVLDRTHDPERVPLAVAWARAAGFEQISLDLIFGSPGESLPDWRTSLESALACEPDHVSAYSLIVEPGTALARRVRRGELPPPDEDDLADKYELADDLLTAAGLGWYEVSNWARPGAACRHNLHYWRGANWWGIGPGAHSHVDGVRWWNVKHPSAYVQRLASGSSPMHEHEVLTAQDRWTERVLLESRLVEGMVISELPASAVAEVVADGLATVESGRLVLTRRGRLLGDAVVRRLLPD